MQTIAARLTRENKGESRLPPTILVPWSVDLKTKKRILKIQRYIHRKTINPPKHWALKYIVENTLDWWIYFVTSTQHNDKR